MKCFLSVKISPFLDMLWYNMVQEIEITDISASGDGVGKVAGKTVFVEGALPQETVQITITEDKPRFAKAKLVSINTSSPERVTPICPLFGTCGGCQLMHLSYPEQLKWKQKRVQQTLKRVGNIDAEVASCIASPEELGYRNKIVLHNGGLHKRNSHDIVPVKRCYIHNDIGEKRLEEIAEAKEGMVRTAISTGEVLIVKDGLPDKQYITEHLEDLTFRIRPNDFFQINPMQAIRLYRKAIACGRIIPSDRVLDAYCGVGCLSLFAAKHAKWVEGIESGRSAIKSARENAALNGIQNVTFHVNLVEELIPSMGIFAVAFINPPRAGVAQKVLHTLLHYPPKRLIYISCDPATLARDLKQLQEGFAIEEICPFDLFPQTVHVETLVSMVRKDSLPGI